MDAVKECFQLGLPDYVTLETESKVTTIRPEQNVISTEDICLTLSPQMDQEDILLTSGTAAVKYIKLRWLQKLERGGKLLGDAWERGYGDLEWRGICGSRFMPWYFLYTLPDTTIGFGVKVRPSAMCYWQADTEGITLFLDVRCGGKGVVLKGRTLLAAQIVCMERKGGTSFEAARDFCSIMCTDPILPDFPVYGSNNWYYAYGDSSEEEILCDTDYVLELAKDCENPPCMVIDDCWQEHHRLNEYNGGPWRKGNEKFPDMKGLADKLVKKGVRPGIWMRLLQNEEEGIPPEWRLSHNGCLDPTNPEALSYIKKDVERIFSWGYQLLKHDFSTFDLFGKWGFEMNPLVTGDGWHFYDQGKTSAEAVKLFYQAVYEVSKEFNGIILGCNTIGHLGAGLMHINRTGDDTSGINWERTRRMGINTLAFRLPQHGTFYEVDADCVGILGKIPWELNRQWADVIAKSGTPFFISAKPGVLTKEEIEELRQIMLSASRQDCHRVPKDWEETDCPSIWVQGEDKKEYCWYEKAGAVLESKTEKYSACIPLS